MEKFQELKDKAKKNIKIADHMLYVTYPLIKDPKLLLAIIDNIFLTYTNAMAAILHYERLFKRIPPFKEDSFEDKFNIFKDKIIKRHNIDKSYLTEIRNIKDIIVEHKKSPVEFTKADKFVICSDNYRLKTISINDMKKYINKAKVFIEAMNNIIDKNGRIFKRH